MPPAKGFWRYSAWDSMLVGVLVVHLAVMIGGLWIGRHVSYWWLPCYWAVLSSLYFYNVIVVNHEFSHTPFFVSKRLNRAFRVVSSMTLMYPMSIVEESHRLHHVFANDRKDKDGNTGDPLSTFRSGRDGLQEHVISYVLLNFIRGNHHGEIMRLMNGAQKRVPLWIIYMEILGVVLLGGVLCAANPAWFFAGVIPSIYLGWVLSDLQNYYEHHHATNREDRLADSVSYYGRFYNTVMCNEGYHQEHHFRQGVHWTTRPALRKKLLEDLQESEAYEASFPPTLGFLDNGPSI